LSGGRAGRRDGLRRRDDHQLRRRIPRRVRSSPGSDWQKIARRGHLGRNRFRGRLGSGRDRRHGRALRDHHQSPTLFVARCIGETIDTPGYFGGRCGSPGSTRRHVCGSGCGHGNADRKYDVQRKLRGGPRENCSVTSPPARRGFCAPVCRELDT
jgi:hypothetical protein